MEIRRFELSDSDAVITLWNSVFNYSAPHNDPALSIRRKMSFQPELFFVAIKDVRVIGTVMAGYDGHRGWIYSLAVDPAKQHSGIGSALMAHSETALKSLGCVKVNLQLLASNTATTAFYKKAGYAVEERISMGKVI